MSDYAIMPYQDYKDSCDAIREKTGSTALIKSGEMAELIMGIQGDEENLDAEISAQEDLLAIQDAKIAELAEILAEKTSGSGASMGTATVTIDVSSSGHLAELHYITTDGTIGYTILKTGIIEIECCVPSIIFTTGASYGSFYVDSGDINRLTDKACYVFGNGYVEY